MRALPAHPPVLLRNVLGAAAGIRSGPSSSPRAGRGGTGRGLGAGFVLQVLWGRGWGASFFFKWRSFKEAEATGRPSP